MCGFRHDDRHLRSALNQATAEISGLVGRNTSGDTQQNFAIVKYVCHGRLWSYKKTALRLDDDPQGIDLDKWPV
jgi:hypothetical protein